MITVPHAGFLSSLQTSLGWAPSSEDKCRNPRGSLSDEIIAEKHNKGKQGDILKPSDFTLPLIFLSEAAEAQHGTAGSCQEVCELAWNPSLHPDLRGLRGGRGPCEITTSMLTGQSLPLPGPRSWTLSGLFNHTSKHGGWRYVPIWSITKRAKSPLHLSADSSTRVQSFLSIFDLSSLKYRHPYIYMCIPMKPIM